MASTSTSGSFLAISDIHLDPFTDVASDVVDTLFESKTPVSDWKGIIAKLKLKPTHPGKYPHEYEGRDANYPLMLDTIAHAATTAPDVDFILYPGDFLRHDVWSHGLDDAGYKKMFEVVLYTLGIAYPDTPIFMTFGNDDSYTRDYDLDPGLLTDMATMCRPYLGSTVDDAGFASFASTGCYSATLPGTSTRLISLANVSWSHSHMNYMSAQRGSAVMDYLKTELAAAAATQQPVWLLMHIPPGGATHGSGTHVTANWKDPYNAEFQDVLNTYAGLVEIAFCGHTHMDDFRFGKYGDPSTPGSAEHVVMYKIVPGVSPKFGQNPSFQVYTTTNGIVSDWTTHYRETYPTGAKHWTQSYSAAADYHYTDPAQLCQLFLDMTSKNPSTQAVTAMGKYARDFKVHRHPIDSSYVARFVDNAVHLARHPARGHVPTSEEPVTEIVAAED